MRITFKHPETGWREFTKQEYLCLLQPAHSVFRMFEYFSKIPVILDHEGMAVCSKQSLAEVRRQYPKANSFSVMLSRVPRDEIPMHQSMNVELKDFI